MKLNVKLDEKCAKNTIFNRKNVQKILEIGRKKDHVN